MPLEAYYWLGGSFAAAVLLDCLVTRLLLELLRPPSAAVFLAGRAGKLAAASAWLAYLAGWWWPRFLPDAAGALPLARAAAFACAGVLLLLAYTSLPRAGSGGSRHA